MKVKKKMKKKMKKRYERAELNLIELDAKDIIMTSNDEPELDDNEMPIL